MLVLDDQKTEKIKNWDYLGVFLDVDFVWFLRERSVGNYSKSSIIIRKMVII
jgi:hypothetical protein